MATLKMTDQIRKRLSSCGVLDLLEDATNVQFYPRVHSNVHAKVIRVWETRGHDRWFLTLTLLFDNRDVVNVRIYEPRTPNVSGFRGYLGADVTKISLLTSFRTRKSKDVVIIAEWLGTRPNEELCGMKVPSKSNLMTTAGNAEPSNDSLVRVSLSESLIEGFSSDDLNREQVVPGVYPIDSGE